MSSHKYSSGVIGLQCYITVRERPIRDLLPMSDVAMAISTDADTDADVACLSHIAKWPVIVTS